MQCVCRVAQTTVQCSMVCASHPAGNTCKRHPSLQYSVSCAVRQPARHTHHSDVTPPPTPTPTAAAAAAMPAVRHDTRWGWLCGGHAGCSHCHAAHAPRSAPPAGAALSLTWPAAACQGRAQPNPQTAGRQRAVAPACAVHAGHAARPAAPPAADVAPTEQRCAPAAVAWPLDRFLTPASCLLPG